MQQNHNTIRDYSIGAQRQNTTDCVMLNNFSKVNAITPISDLCSEKHCGEPTAAPDSGALKWRIISEILTTLVSGQSMRSGMCSGKHCCEHQLQQQLGKILSALSAGPYKEPKLTSESLELSKILTALAAGLTPISDLCSDKHCGEPTAAPATGALKWLETLIKILFALSAGRPVEPTFIPSERSATALTVATKTMVDKAVGSEIVASSNKETMTPKSHTILHFESVNRYARLISTDLANEGMKISTKSTKEVINRFIDLSESKNIALITKKTPLVQEAEDGEESAPNANREKLAIDKDGRFLVNTNNKNLDKPLGLYSQNQTNGSFPPYALCFNNEFSKKLSGIHGLNKRISNNSSNLAQLKKILHSLKLLRNQAKSIGQTKRFQNLS